MLTIYYNTARQQKLEELVKPKPGAWLHVIAPEESELEQLSEEFGLELDLLRDGIDPNETPRIEYVDGNTYIYDRFCLPENEKQTTSPMLLVMTSSVVITISKKPFEAIDTIIERGITTSKRSQLVFALLAEINQGYKQRINKVSRRIWEIRGQLDKSTINNKDFVGFIDIEEDLNDFLLALEPMNGAVHSLLTGKYFRLYEDDEDLVEDLELSIKELIDLATSRLKTIQNVREAYNTLTANNLNRVFKLMTSITILMSVFTIFTGIYSMNIALPLAHEKYVFWVILGVSGAIIGALAYLFRRKRWL